MTATSIDDVKKRRDKIQSLTSDLAVLKERQRQVGEQLSSVDEQIKAIVGDEDPDKYLEKMKADITTLEAKIDLGLKKAEVLVTSMKGEE